MYKWLTYFFQAKLMSVVSSSVNFWDTAPKEAQNSVLKEFWPYLT